MWIYLSQFLNFFEKQVIEVLDGNLLITHPNQVTLGPLDHLEKLLILRAPFGRLCSPGRPNKVLEHLKQKRSVEAIPVPPQPPHMTISFLELQEGLLEAEVILVFGLDDVDGHQLRDKGRGILDLLLDLVLELLIQLDVVAQLV